MRVILAGLVATIVMGAEPKATEWTFAKADVDKLPAGWTAAKTGKDEGSVWKVAADESAPSKTGHVLMQTAAGPNSLFNLCLVDDSKFFEGEISVQVKAISGKLDQGGGLVWRLKDPNNYYICRFNPLEDNFRLYKVIDGNRIQLDAKPNITLPKDSWFTVSIRHRGTKIECSLNGKRYLEATDATFRESGKIGLWTKADAVSAFDKLTMTAIER